MNNGSPSDPDRTMLENSLAFFGAITASVSHELNNVMAIIDQNNGLMADLLLSAKPEHPVSSERLQRITEGISSQIERGVHIIKRLNSFAHSVDDPIREFDLVQLIDNFIKLAQRLASLKKVTLESQHDVTEVKIQNSPFLLQQVLFLSIQRLLAMSQPGNLIKVATKKENTKIQIEITGRRHQAAIPDWDQTYIVLLMNFIGGSLDISADGEFETIMFALNLKVV